MLWTWITGIVCLIIGLVAGFAIGVFYLRNQMTKMQSDPEMIQKMAKQMGYNLNTKQMQAAQKMMKNGGSGQMKPGGGSKGKKKKS
ncbi:YneF family protein [Paenibacillus aquistagni]|uniref:Uncharacterized protein n=1 Tax=Paenibacillus aquistagni TaxID=1852522 RepID=A0A1X7LCV5_9BACL|nr:YneF family protein [Paenibacillus aquistagni]SMG51696.1 hypothetical protein SAMN06295960_3283 [Paenibacillus aquistagni]